MSSSLEKIEGNIVRVIYDNISFQILSVETADKNKIIVRGSNMPCTNKKLKLAFWGQWTVDKKYGEQFKVEYAEPVIPNTSQGIKAYLKALKIKGVGKSLINKIVDAYKDKTIEVIKETPNALQSIRGCSEEKIKKIVDAISESESLGTLMLYLNKYEISTNQILQINKAFGKSAISLIEKNPFIILSINGIGFMTADRLAKSLKIKLDSEERIVECVKYCLKNEEVNGNTFALTHLIKQKALNLLNEGFVQKVVEQQLFDKVIQNNKLGITLRAQGNALVLDSTDNAESSTARKLCELNQEGVTDKDIQKYKKSLDNYCLTSSIKPSAAQQEAIMLALSNRATVITGGPGCGKTTIIKAIISAYKAVNPNKEITLLAPTGKAARRMSQATGFGACTIHSALHLRKDDLPAGEFITLPKGLVVVDEMSMIDQYVMAQLMKSITALSSTTLVMVGDPDQLQSVGAGNVLKDIIDSNVIPTYKLTEIFRQKDGDNVLLDNIYKINSNNKTLEFNSSFILDSASTDEETLNKLLNIYSKEVAEKGIEQVMVLCPYRYQSENKSICVDVLNKKIQELINPQVGSEISCKIGNNTFRVGDRIIQNKNTENASNGDIGIIKVIEFDDDEEEYVFKIRFENDNNVSYYRDDMMNVDLAYAITIHRSQGSEYKTCIIPVLYAKNSAFFTKNLLYTAVTRCKERVYLLGSLNEVYSCMNRSVEGKRNTFLMQWLNIAYNKLNQK